MDTGHQLGCQRLWSQNILFFFVMCTVLVQLTSGRIYNDPEYDWAYLEDDCQPFNETDSPANWNRRVKNLTDGSSLLYGYVQPERDNVYRGPLNCAIKVVAPPGYRLVVRIPRVEIYHDETECTYDYMSVIGATDELKYCGFGTVTHSIYSTSNWLIFRILASQWDANHDYIGFLLYYTAVHSGSCETSGPNATEWRCGGMDWCTPSKVVCDAKDNCGSWEEEMASVCGLTEGAIVAISVVSILVGGTALFFIGYCIYNQQKQKKARERRQRAVSPTMTVGQGAHPGHVIMSPVPPTLSGQGAMAEPPPPYTPIAFVNLGYGDVAIGQLPIADPAGNPNAAADALTNVDVTGNTTSLGNNINIQYTHAASLRPTIGDPPPIYTQQIGGAVAEGVTQPQGGVSFEALPEKSDTPAPS